MNKTDHHRSVGTTSLRLGVAFRAVDPPEDQPAVFSDIRCLLVLFGINAEYGDVSRETLRAVQRAFYDSVKDALNNRQPPESPSTTPSRTDARSKPCFVVPTQQIATTSKSLSAAAYTTREVPEGGRMHRM
ncbi:MAG TPA: hypothetical protein VFR23_13585 [Jiangellaceae bacterium]|nr:hypothetical protein [Jiangellaceae bacterium]